MCQGTLCVYSIPDAPWNGNIYLHFPLFMWLFLTFHVGKYSRPIRSIWVIFEQWNKPWLFSVYRGWNTTQLYRDDFINQYKDPVINHPVFLMESKAPRVFWAVAHLDDLLQLQKFAVALGAAGTRIDLWGGFSSRHNDEGCLAFLVCFCWCCFVRGTTRSLGDLLNMVVNHLLSGMILQVGGGFKYVSCLPLLGEMIIIWLIFCK